MCRQGVRRTLADAAADHGLAPIQKVNEAAVLPAGIRSPRTYTSRYDCAVFDFKDHGGQAAREVVTQRYAIGCGDCDTSDSHKEGLLYRMASLSRAVAFQSEWEQDLASCVLKKLSSGCPPEC
jgi:hypothetical protein